MTIEYKDSKRISALSTDIVDTATYTDDFDTDDWDNMSSRINVNTTTEKLDFAMYRDGANDSAVHDLGVGNVSDTAWILRWKMNFTAVYSGGNGNRLWFGLSSLPQTTAQNSAQDSIMMYQNHDGTDCFSASYSDGTALPQTNTTNPDYATGTDYYCELKRTSSTTIESRMWTGGYDGTLLTSAEDSVSNSTIGSVTGLRYVKMSNIKASQGGSIITGTVDDVEFYNGVTSLTNKPTNVQDNSILVEKDTARRYWFDEATAPSSTQLYEGSNSDSDILTTGGSTNFNINSTVSDALYFNPQRSSSIFGQTWDLGSNLSETAWVLRAKMNITSLDNSGDTVRLFIGMNNQDSSVGASNSSNKFIGAGSFINSSGQQWYRVSVKGNTLDVGEANQHTIATGMLYIEIIRKTETTYSVRWTTSSDFTGGTLVDNQTVGSNGGSGSTSSMALRYFWMSNINVNGNQDAHIQGHLEDVKIYDGVTSATPATWTGNIDLTGLKAYYKFDEASGDIINQATSVGSTDSLGSAADIQITGSSYDQPQSPFGYSMLFDGVDDFGVFGTSKSQWNFMHNTTSKFTINFWARMQDFGEKYFLSAINTDAYRGVMVRSSPSTNRLNSYINSNTSAALILNKNSSDNYFPDTSAWYMYTLTWDISLASNNYSLFRNASNEENANDASTATDGDNQYVFTIGARASDHTQNLNFYVSELSIWNRVLTDDEITTLYNAGRGKAVY